MMAERSIAVARRGIEHLRSELSGMEPEVARCGASQCLEWQYPCPTLASIDNDDRPSRQVIVVLRESGDDGTPYGVRK